ncbi:hypothetical protein Hs20B_01730 [Lactococcus insecticola]|uniref:Uncharacterized protein n=2 Tax=Pseudolactococcus insecticola TaxID=2709158 RepID=A0A6A0B4Z4_9LACT|nr:hypothetical protein Hs20B_01730 [Lactococcus insecticola]
MIRFTKIVDNDEVRTYRVTDGKGNGSGITSYDKLKKELSYVGDPFFEHAPIKVRTTMEESVERGIELPDKFTYGAIG